MKAIHNFAIALLYESIVGNYKLKYNFESNSQPSTSFPMTCSVGNYKLKYNFESNSQHNELFALTEISWEL